MFRNPFYKIFDIEHVLTPIAVEHLADLRANTHSRSYRIVYIFGIRVAFFSTVKH